MKACRRNERRVFHALLPGYFRKIRPSFRSLFIVPAGRIFIKAGFQRRQHFILLFFWKLQIGNHLIKPAHPNSPHSRRRRGFPDVFFRHNTLLYPGIHSLYRQRQNAPHPFYFPGKPQLAHNQRIVRASGRNPPLSGKYAKGNGQIKACPLFFQVRRRQIHGNMHRRQRNAAVFQGNPDPLSGLSHLPAKAANHDETGQTGRQIHLHLNQMAFHAINGS